MLTKIQYDILVSCYFEPELFYFPFAQVNYGGQVFPTSYRGKAKESQIEDARKYKITVPPEVVVENIIELIGMKMMRCWSISEPSYKREEITTPTFQDFEQYDGYDLLRWDQHIEKFDYGPHEFKISQKGRAEIDKDIYSNYRGS